MAGKSVAAACRMARQTVAGMPTATGGPGSDDPPDPVLAGLARCNDPGLMQRKKPRRDAPPAAWSCALPGSRPLPSGIPITGPMPVGPRHDSPVYDSPLPDGGPPNDSVLDGPLQGGFLPAGADQNGPHSNEILQDGPWQNAPGSGATSTDAVQACCGGSSHVVPCSSQPVQTPAWDPSLKDSNRWKAPALVKGGPGTLESMCSGKRSSSHQAMADNKQANTVRPPVKPVLKRIKRGGFVPPRPA